MGDHLEQEIAKAERLLKASEAAAAKAMGYRLCRCTFPPQIMLWKKTEKVHVCPECEDVAWEGMHISGGALKYLDQKK